MQGVSYLNVWFVQIIKRIFAWRKRKVRKILKRGLAFTMSAVMATGIVCVGPFNVKAADKAEHVLIHEIYGGGGNSGATYKNDYIVLYNPTSLDVSLDGWSVQYASKTGKFDKNITTLSGTIKSGGYYLIEEGKGSGGTADLENPDAVGTIAMGKSDGKIALSNKSDAISGKSDASVVDFVGFGAANEYEGAKAAYAPSNTQSIVRKETGVDTDDNGNDFIQSETMPKNSSYNAGSGSEEKPVEVVQIENVSVFPAVGETLENQQLTFTCSTTDATIKYKINNSAEAVYDKNNKPVLSSLPATVVVWAEKDGMKSSEKMTYQYTKKQTETGEGSQSGSGSGEGTQSEHTGDYNIYFGQLHSHTNLSDGAGTVKEAFEHASKVDNLDFLAVTDHSNSFEDKEYTHTLSQDASDNSKWNEGKTAAKDITDKKIKNTDNVTDSDSTFLGVYGFEMTWSDGCGHINTFNTPGFENRNNPIFQNKKQSMSNPSGLDTYYKKLAQANGSISQFNHPGTTFGDFYDFSDYNAAYDQKVNLIEVGNGEGAIGSNGYFPSYSYYTRALDKGWHVAPTNNQDNHKRGWGDANTARSVILADDLSEASLYDAMQNRRVYATEDSDLSIQYTLNGHEMGSILSEKPDKVELKAKLSDPTDSSIGKVEVIVNGGKVAASKDVADNNATVDFTLDDNYSYYYLRITQKDGNIAVTAPVWTGDVEKAGIASTSSDTELPVKGESINITTQLFNNETTDMTVNSLEYSVDGKTIKTVDGSELEGGAVVAGASTKGYTFAYTPDTNGEVNINVKMSATVKGVEKIYTDTLQINVADPKTVTKVLIDGTHLNDYVNGYYTGNMTNFINICANDGVQARIETENITKEMLDETDLLVITAPLKYDKSGELTPTSFSDDFMKMVSEYVNGGGTAVICGLADYQDSNTGDPYTTTTQINDLLKAMGAKTTLNSDEVYDATNNDGQPYRLKLDDYNTASEWLNGVDPAQVYSVYSGCTVNPASESDWLVKGHDTTYSINSKKLDNSKYESVADKNSEVVKAGDACVLSTEKVGDGRIFVAGTVFMSNFEVKATMDNYSDLQYANYTLVNNIVDSVKKQVKTSSIEDVRKNGKAGDVFAIEGIVTAGSEGPNAFFDTIYVQDATGGIDIFPIANGSGIKIGQRIRVIGHVDYYQGDKELKIGKGIEGYEILDESINEITPEKVSASEAMDYDKNGGKLLQVSGTISDIKSVNGAITSFMVDDGSEKKAKIYLNGNVAGATDLSEVVKENNNVSVVGIVYMDPEGTCLRVRDGKEITLNETSGGSGSQSGSGSESGQPSTGEDTKEKLPEAVVTQKVEEIKKAGAGDNIVIEMNDATVVPEEIFEAVKGKDENVVFNMQGYSWKINGKEVTGDNLKDVNLLVEFDKNVIPDDVVVKTAAGKAVKKLSLAYDGQFGFTANLTFNAGKEYAGYNADLYYYDEETGRLELKHEYKINEDGTVDLSFSHASDYILVMQDATENNNGSKTENDNNSGNAGQIESNGQNNEFEQKVSSQSEEKTQIVTKTESADSESPKTGDKTLTAPFAIGAVISAAAAGLVALRKKRRV